MFILPKRTSYDLDGGGYLAFLKDAFIVRQSVNGKDEDMLRLVFQIVSLKHPRYNYLAGKNYKMSDAAKIGHDLDTWIGDDLVGLLNENGAITIEAIETLKGREADIEIVLIYNDKHETAFRHIVRILPPGTLVDDDQLREAA
jgi:hypothetical protein